MRGQVPVWLVSLCVVLGGVAAAALTGLWRAQRRQKELERRQSEFVAAVSHEFRSPLTTIRHLTELLLQGRLPGEEMRQRCLEHIEKETERLNTLVEDLLEFGRIESKRRIYRRTSTDVGLTVLQAVDEFRQDPESVAHEFNVDRVTSGLWSVIDAGAVRRAVRNLLENAVKYSPAGTTVWIGVALTNGEVAITVRDEGSGVAKEEQAAVFEKFVRGRAALEARVKGTGIGLALVKSIADAHGGHVGLESEPGRGSTFSITIPVERA